jgi:hypothetical protein
MQSGTVLWRGRLNLREVAAKVADNVSAFKTNGQTPAVLAFLPRPNRADIVRIGEQTLLLFKTRHNIRAAVEPEHDD